MGFHQKGPEIPNLNATLDDCSSVAAQVHWDTMWQAIQPELMERPADPKCSLDVERVLFCSIFDVASHWTMDTNMAKTAAQREQ